MKQKIQNTIIKPKLLHKGDSVCLIAPSGAADYESLRDAIIKFEGLGLKVYFSEKILARDGYLAGNDAHRAEDIEQVFANKSIDAVICLRGGYGSMRLLQQIDYKIIKNNPKPFVGFSDITALLHAIFAKTGLVGYHGLLGVSPFTPYSIKCFEQMLMSDKANPVIETADKSTCFAINEGVAQGTLLGGNLSILVSLLATPYDLSWKNAIVFMEDISEEPYRIDRMLTTLLLSGKLKQVAGIVLGNFKRCDASNPEKSFTTMQVLTERLSSLKVPILAGFSFGHINDNCTLPIGVKAILNTESKTITIV